MAVIALSGERRSDPGKGGARKARAAGRIPGIVYGHGDEPVPISIDARAFQLAIQHLLLSAGWKKQVTVKPREVAGDVLLSGNGFNPVDRRAVTFRRQACPPFAVQALDFEVTVVDRIGQMGCGNFGHAAGQGTVVENGHGLAGFREQVCGGQAGNARADYADIRAGVFLK